MIKRLSLYRYLQVLTISPFLLTALPVAHAQPIATETILHNFNILRGGVKSNAGVIGDAAGNLYGTTIDGGPMGAGVGVVYRIDSTGHYTVLYSFTGGMDGCCPSSGLIRDAAGNLFGTAPGGGGSNVGVVYKLDPTGVQTVLHSFNGGTDGASPEAGVILDGAGNLYGTTQFGGLANRGVVYKVDPAGVETLLHTFTGGADGGEPTSGVLLDATGNLFGNTELGGSFNKGVVYKLSPAGSETVLHEFTGGSDGSQPSGSLIADKIGNLYGTTYLGGATNCGVVYKVNAAGEEILHSFTAITDGCQPLGLVLGSSGTLYGAATFGGVANGGLLYELDMAGTQTVLYTFTGPDGRVPNAVNRDNAGNVYGTTREGGAQNMGVVFKIATGAAETF